MSDSDSQPAEQPAEEQPQVEEEEVVGEETPQEALRSLLKRAQYNDTLFKGLHEACRQIEKDKAELCVLASDCDQQGYKDLITLLCKEKNIMLFKVDSRAELGEMCGLCKFDEEGEARNVRNTSCCVVKYLTEGPSKKVVVEYLKSQE